MEREDVEATLPRQLTFQQLLDAKERDMQAQPGYTARFDPEEAEADGAFEDEALDLDSDHAFDPIDVGEIEHG